MYGVDIYIRFILLWSKHCNINCVYIISFYYWYILYDYKFVYKQNPARTQIENVYYKAEWLSDKKYGRTEIYATFSPHKNLIALPFISSWPEFMDCFERLSELFNIAFLNLNYFNKCCILNLSWLNFRLYLQNYLQYSTKIQYAPKCAKTFKYSCRVC